MTRWIAPIAVVICILCVWHAVHNWQWAISRDDDVPRSVWYAIAAATLFALIAIYFFLGSRE